MRRRLIVKTMSELFDVVVIGAGAAGLMCASECGQSGLRTALLEQNKQVGRKILISGGGRCNFTNKNTTSEQLASKNTHFSKSALSQYAPYDFIELIKKYEIPYFEKHRGQLFCEKSAKDVVAMLLKECESGNVDLRLQSVVEDIDKLDDVFEIKTTRGVFRARHVVVSTGGLSIPTLGANGVGYQWAKKWGHRLIETSPALVPLLLDEAEDQNLSELSGVSLPVKISVPEISFEEDLLFTHKGISGPAVLQISLYWKPKEVMTIDFLPTVDLNKLMLNLAPKAYLENELKKYLPTRFVEKWVKLHGREKTYLAEWSKKERLALAEALKNWRIIPKGTEGYRKAEVTRGGVSTDRLSSKTMESQLTPGLYFIGEVVDVTGWLGGYNFQWAWASAFACAQGIISKG